MNRSKLSAALVVLASLLLFGGDCGGYNRESFLAPTDPGTQFLLLATSSGALQMEANGARLGIIASIDPNSTQRMIKFTTTEGTFAGAATATPKEISVTIDGLGKARAELVSSANLVTTVVRAEVVNKAEVANTIEIEFVAPEFSLRAADGKTTLRADGEDSVTLIATLASGSQNRVVRFTTDKGTLVGGVPSGATNTSQDREVTADASGEALIVLRSSTATGIAIVTAQPKGAPAFLRTLEIFFEGPDDVIEFATAPAVAPADGATATEFTVDVSLQTAGLEVTFKTTAGSFSPTVTTMDSITAPLSQGSATAVLYSPKQIARAKVTATVPSPSSDTGSFSTETFIDFVRALPNRIQVSLNDITVTDNLTDNLTVTATLLRDVGDVTQNTIVTFTATLDANGQTFGLFRNVQLSQSNGTATAQFFPAASGLTGDATITVGAEGTGVTGTAAFKVVP